MNVTSALLDFLMNLLRNPEAAAAFRADPDAALEKAGLANVTTEDCDAVMPVVLDYAPVIGNRDYDTGDNTSNGGNAGGGGHHGGGHHPAPSVSGGGNSAGGDHAHAVQQIEYVVKNYSYTTTDDRDTITDQSVNQNIWAGGDVTQLFDNDAVVASGDHAVAAGDDAWVDQSTDNSTNFDNEGDVNVGNDHSVNDSYNQDNDIDHSFNEDNDHTVKDSYNQDNDITHKEDNDYTHTEDNDIVVKDNELNIGNEDNDTTVTEDNDFTDNTNNSQDNDVTLTDNTQDNDVTLTDNSQDNDFTQDNSSDDDVVIKDNYTEVEIEDNVVIPVL